MPYTAATAPPAPAEVFVRRQSITIVCLLASVPLAAIGQLVPTTLGLAAVLVSIALCLAAGVVQVLAALALTVRSGPRRRHLLDRLPDVPAWFLPFVLVAVVGHAALILVSLGA